MAESMKLTANDAAPANGLGTDTSTQANYGTNTELAGLLVAGNAGEAYTAGAVVAANDNDLEMNDHKKLSANNNNNDNPLSCRTANANDNDIDNTDLAGGLDSDSDSESAVSDFLKKTNLALLKKRSDMVVIFFSFVALASIACVIVGILGFGAFEFGTIWVIILINLMGSSFGAYGAYKWGTVSQTIQEMSTENDQFRSSMVSLDISKDRLKKSVAELTESTRNLKQSSSEIKEHLKSFEDVYASLKSVSAQSTDIYQSLDSVLDVFSAMEESVKVSKRATLMNIYYQVSFLCDERGGGNTKSQSSSSSSQAEKKTGMDSEEYEELLALLQPDEREMFEQFGTFDQLSGNDDIIDVIEFQQLIDRAIHKLDQSGSFDLRSSMDE